MILDERDPGSVRRFGPARSIRPLERTPLGRRRVLARFRRSLRRFVRLECVRAQVASPALIFQREPDDVPRRELQIIYRQMAGRVLFPGGLHKGGRTPFLASTTTNSRAPPGNSLRYQKRVLLANQYGSTPVLNTLFCVRARR